MKERPMTDRPPASGEPTPEQLAEGMLRLKTRAEMEAASGEPSTEAGRALLYALGRRSWSREAFRQSIRAIESEARATPPALDRPTLVAAIDESGLIDRLRDYFREAHPDGGDVSRGVLLNEWSTKIATEYVRFSASGERAMGEPSTEAGQRLASLNSSEMEWASVEPEDVKSLILAVEAEAALPEPALDVAQVRRAISSHRAAMDDQRQKYHCGPASCVHDIYARLVPSDREAEPEARE
jgi:hypothetical protein